MVPQSKGKCVIFSAPSGAGKTSIVRYLLKEIPELKFSVSATSREKRSGEQNGKDYYFISVEEFENKIDSDEFVEYEEVYSGQYYGTLVSEVERIWSEGKIVIFDVDVMGGLNLKDYFEDKALAIFVKPPSIPELEKRLLARGMDNPDSVKKRMNKASLEMDFAERFDEVVENTDLQAACREAKALVTKFLR